MPIVAQLLQVLFVLLFAPLLKGIMDRVKARGMRRVGPPILQPYRNLWKWAHKQLVRAEYTTGFADWVPVLYFTAPLVVTLLIPVLTTMPLPLAFMADMLGGGLILAGAGFVLLFYALDSGSAYAAIGVSRIRLIGTLGEPLTVIAVFTAAAVGRSTIPYAVNQAFWAQGFAAPSHLLVMLAWFLLLLAEAGRLPVDNPDSSQELSLIDPNRVFEASGPDLALLEWGGWMKYMVLSVILVNVLGAPAGLAATLTLPALGVALVTSALKLVVVGLVVVAVELSFAKLRLMRIAEYLTLSVAVAALAALAVGL
jgi:formate hydrogenlyase subunit 4